MWWNDPDMVVLTGGLTEDEFRFHTTAICASGRMLLSGDDLTKISADKPAMWRKMQPATGVAARFTDISIGVGMIDLPDRRAVCIFNPDDAPRTLSFRLPQARGLTYFWSGEMPSRHEGEFAIKDMPSHPARLVVCT